jgi:cation-transporting P-type ATPase E
MLTSDVLTGTGAVTADTGLTAGEVADRVARRQTNRTRERTSRTIGEILRANLLTRFNLILGVLLVVILAVGDPQDGLFGIVLVSNAVVGIAQELRAKRTLDRLAVLNAPLARVVRDGASEEVAIDDVVLDDLVELRSGDQVVADGVVVEAAGLEVDESLLTGEADAVDKVAGVTLLSGSFVVAGTGRFRTTAVGESAYARRLASEARRFALVRSDLMDGINRILRYVTWLLVPAALVLVISQMHVDSGWRDAVSGTVGGLVGMVPQGLVLLTSIAFAVAAVTLARRRVLVQELPAVEGLARVDVVCFDKTGTLTDGTITLAGVETFESDCDAEAVLGALADTDARNTTLSAIAARLPPPPGWARITEMPFSSARKWSAAAFEDRGAWVLGAPEIVGLPTDEVAVRRAADLAAGGHRVLLLARASGLFGAELPDDRRAVALVSFEERLRPDATQTLAYFASQGVAVKMISGDSPRTLGAVARAVGISDAEEPVDARELADEPEALAAALESRSVFGRVTPVQKQSMVRALQARGHAVAMTGDGVNDVLALKLADIGIAMGSGAPATRAVAQLVLLDGRFATLPGVVAEGRRVTANIERVANLFVTKTVWATLLALTVGVAQWPYPFLPRHLSIIDSLSIGVPAFFLALAPNARRYVPGFVARVLRFAIPAGLLVAAATFTAFVVARAAGLPLDQQRTAAMLVTLALSLGVLTVLALPLTPGRAALVVGAVVAFALLFPIERVRDFCALDLPTGVLGWVIGIAVAGFVALVAALVVSRERAHT